MPEADSGSDWNSQNGNGHATILCVGNDDTLLSYRSQVLRRAGFQVISARPQPEKPNQFADLCRLHGPAMVVVCHTLSAAQRIMMTKELRSACPRTKLLALTNGSLTSEEARSYDWLIDSLDGPAALIEHIRSNI